jgi:hypothetical protein
MIASNYRGDATALIEINNGSQTSYNGTKIKIGGLPGKANACYCPTGAASTIDWGSERICGASCPDGGRSGRYVSVSAQQAYTPLFSLFDVVKDGSISAGEIDAIGVVKEAIQDGVGFAMISYQRSRGT